MCRKSSQQNDSTDFEPQSDLITALPNVGIGTTRPVEKPSGPALVDKIGLNYQNDVSEIGIASDEMCICRSKDQLTLTTNVSIQALCSDLLGRRLLRETANPWSGILIDMFVLTILYTSVLIDKSNSIAGLDRKTVCLVFASRARKFAIKKLVNASSLLTSKNSYCV
ncbi:hypothetical protein BY996DRAFT_6426501 [Phakopsora pachyrhizi]|nr:hypothetical protein BY996DRAFT_6426501 [Phakopsora pachyrhizi]